MRKKFYNFGILDSQAWSRFVRRSAVSLSATGRGGFTLIELLVVIAIIGLLASVILVALNDARGSARDARRKADLKQIASALDLYFAQYQTYLVTDPVTHTITGDNQVGNGFFSAVGGNYHEAVGQGLVGAGFLAKNPIDPSGATGNGSGGSHSGYMIYAPYNSTFTTGYCLYAQLENPSSEDAASYKSLTTGGNRGCSDESTYQMNYVITHR